MQLFELMTQCPTDYVWPKPVEEVVRPQEGHRPPPAPEEGEKVRFAGAGQAEEGWTSAPHQPLNLSIGDLYRLGLQAQGPSRCLDPAPKPLSTVSCQIVWRGRDLN
jgi:hypothetical protein